MVSVINRREGFNLGKNLSTLLIDELIHSMENIVNIRDFTDDSIDEETIEKLFQAFIYGPSLANQQPWECLLVNKTQQQEMVRATLDPFMTENSHNGQSWIASTPFVFVVLLDRRRAEARLGKKGMDFSEQDVFASIQNFRLAAYLEGLGTSVIREFDTECLKDILRIPKSFVPIAIMAMGYPSKDVQLPERFTIDDIVHKERIL